VAMKILHSFYETEKSWEGRIEEPYGNFGFIFCVMFHKSREKYTNLIQSTLVFLIIFMQKYFVLFSTEVEIV
jgi:hypothetical protein